MDEKIKEIKLHLQHIKKEYTESLTYHWSNIDQRATQITTAQLLDACEYLLSRIKKLEDAIDKHEVFKRGHEKVVALEDEQLYQTRKEVI